MKKELLKLEDLNCIKELKDVLYDCYKTDDSFPRSCGAVSMTMAFILQHSNEKLKKDYDINYIRGHFRNDNEEEFTYCDIVEEDFDRNSDISNFECLNCSCDYMIGHSWIELTNKSTKENIILDFTSIQLEDDFIDYYEEIFENTFDKDSLYDYLYTRSKFLVFKEDSRFRKYIKSEKELSGEYIVSITLDKVKEKSQSDLTIILEDIGYKI